MSFRFKKNESVPKAIRRLGCERIGRARESLKDWRRAEAIHEARKDIKKVRAVLRLAHGGIGSKTRARLRRRLREAAERLAGPRDASVEVGTLRKLACHFKGQFAPGALDQVDLALRNAAARETQRFAKEKAAKSVDRTLRRVAKELECLEVEGKGWKALGEGVRIAYSRGQDAYEKACQDGSAEDFHDWRKRAKDLWYQVTMLRPIAPWAMEATAGELEALGEHLGDDHDLVMLQHAVETQCLGDGAAGGARTLTPLIEARQRELRGAALALGAPFYDEKPGAFCDRVAGYWRAWRAGKSPDDRTAEAIP